MSCGKGESELKVTVNTSKEIYKGRVFRLLKENFTLPNQVSVDIETLQHPGAAAVVAVDDTRKVLLVRQYRHAVGKLIWEIPAGTLNPNETPFACAKRELIEETGFMAAQFKRLGEIIPVPGYSDEQITVFLAVSLSADKQSLDKDEYLTVHQFPFDDAMNMIYKGEIQDAKTIAGLFLSQKELNHT
jgi:ADP-ribose pyrophosphatase